MPFKKQ